MSVKTSREGATEVKQTPPVGTVKRSCEFHWHGGMARHVAPLEVERIQQSTRTGTGIANNTCYRIVPASLHFTFPAFTCRQQAASEQAGRQAERQTGRQDTSRTCSCHTDADIPRSLQVDFLATGGQHHHHLPSHLTLLSLLFLVAVVAVVSWCRGDCGCGGRCCSCSSAVVVVVVVVVVFPPSLSTPLSCSTEHQHQQTGFPSVGIAAGRALVPARSPILDVRPPPTASYSLTATIRPRKPPSPSRFRLRLQASSNQAERLG